MFVSDEFSKQALILLDFSSAICYNVYEFKNLSVPSLGNAIFMPFFGHKPLHIHYESCDECAMVCVLNLVVSIYPNLKV